MPQLRSVQDRTSFPVSIDLAVVDYRRLREEAAKAADPGETLRRAAPN